MKPGCLPAEIAHVEGEEVVPDAVSRFLPLDPHPGEHHRNYFFNQAIACMSFEHDVELRRVLIKDWNPALPSEEASKEPRDWIVDYDAAGGFVRLCGPCSSPYDVGSCAGCPL